MGQLIIIIISAHFRRKNGGNNEVLDGARLEKPCVGGSILPGATLNLSMTNPLIRRIFYLSDKLGEKWGISIFPQASALKGDEKKQKPF